MLQNRVSGAVATGTRRVDTDRWRASPAPNRVATLTVDEAVTALHGASLKYALAKQSNDSYNCVLKAALICDDSDAYGVGLTWLPSQAYSLGTNLR